MLSDDSKVLVLELIDTVRISPLDPEAMEALIRFQRLIKELGETKPVEKDDGIHNILSRAHD